MVYAFSTWLNPLLAQTLSHAGQLFFELFGYLFGGWLCVPFLVLFTAALALGLHDRRPLALLTALVFGFALVASMAGHHPFGASRHSCYLLPFIALMKQLWSGSLAGTG